MAGRRGYAKMAQTMREFRSGDLTSGSGRPVTDRDQAIAIGLNQAGLSKKRRAGGGAVRGMGAATRGAGRAQC